MDVKVQRKKVHKWLSEGLTKAECARRLSLARTTLNARIDAWVRDGEFIVPPKPVKETPPPQTPTEAVKSDRKIQNLTEREQGTRKKYKHVLAENEALVRENKALLSFAGNKKSLAILRPRAGNGKGQGIANAMLSDMHMEERVLKNEVEGKNEYNLDISKSRLKEFFQAVLKFVQIEQQNTKIDELVLWLLGDNLTGWLHEECLFVTFLEPVRAAIVCQQRLRQGIQYLLDNSDLKLTIPCVVGNHGRITRLPNHATENGNSLEFMLYHFLDHDFKDNDRVNFIIPESGFAFVDEFGYVIRGHHGHRIRYRGGIQGMGVPAAKKLAQWNKIKYADLDIFGHHHTAQDGDGFVANGSVIGFNSFAYKSGFSFQPPEQKFFLVHSRWGRRNLSRSIFFRK